MHLRKARARGWVRPARHAADRTTTRTTSRPSPCPSAALLDQFLTVAAVIESHCRPLPSPPRLNSSSSACQTREGLRKKNKTRGKFVPRGKHNVTAKAFDLVPFDPRALTLYFCLSFFFLTLRNTPKLSRAPAPPLGTRYATAPSTYALSTCVSPYRGAAVGQPGRPRDITAPGHDIVFDPD